MTLRFARLSFFMHFLDFLAKHLAYLYYFTFLRIIIRLVTTQHPMGISNRLTVVLQQELH